MTIDDGALLGHRNLISYSRASTAWGALGSRREDDGVLLFAGGSWLPAICNGAFEPRVTTVDIESSPIITIRTRDTGEDDDLRAACEAGSMIAMDDRSPEMICRHPLGDPGPPDGVELRVVTDEQGVIDFVGVNGDAYAIYGMPDDVCAATFDRHGVVAADPDVIIVVAYQVDRPVATALTYLSDGIASLQWVGTIAGARQLGMGKAVTAWATNAAFERGARFCTLQASPMGEPLYAQLGYVTLYRYLTYVRWSPPTT